MTRFPDDVIPVRMRREPGPDGGTRLHFQPERPVNLGPGDEARVVVTDGRPAYFVYRATKVVRWRTILLSRFRRGGAKLRVEAHVRRREP